MKSIDNSIFAKNQLLAWLNELLNVNIRSIEDLSNGVVFCQLLSLISPGDIRMQKVNYNAKLQHQNLSNLKILSTSMLALGIDKKFDVQRISQRKYQYILELLQWFRKYFITNNIKNSDNDNEHETKRSSNLIPKSTNQVRLSQFETSKNRRTSNIQRSEITLGPKRQPQDIITDSQLKNCFKINKAIEKIIQINTQKAQNKVELIKALLSRGNNMQKSFKTQKLGDNKELNQSNSIKRQSLVESLPLGEIKFQDNHEDIQNVTIGSETKTSKTTQVAKRNNSAQKRGSHPK